MGFRELREFIDDSLHGPQEPNGRDRPRSKGQFLDLLELLSGKVGNDVDGALASFASLALEDAKLKSYDAIGRT